MGYGYSETFLVIFLTHPGVIIPTDPAGTIPSQYEALVPKDGVPPVMSALWQVMWAWILNLPGTRGPALGWTMYAIYLVFLLVYMYYGLSLRFQKGV
jgi:hypothetical protein